LSALAQPLGQDATAGTRYAMRRAAARW